MFEYIEIQSNHPSNTRISLESLRALTQGIIEIFHLSQVKSSILNLVIPHIITTVKKKKQMSNNRGKFKQQQRLARSINLPSLSLSLSNLFAFSVTFARWEIGRSTVRIAETRFSTSALGFANPTALNISVYLARIRFSLQTRQETGQIFNTDRWRNSPCKPTSSSFGPHFSLISYTNITSFEEAIYNLSPSTNNS